MSETDIASGGVVAEAFGGARSAQRPLPAACYACAAPVLGPYCHSCGQKNDDCRRSLAGLAAESLRDLTAVDGRFATTVRDVVLRPGRHVRRYGDGVRSPFTPPVRLFLVTLFVFFLSLELTDRQLLVLHPELEAEAGSVRFEGGTIGFLQPTPTGYTDEERAALRHMLEEGEEAAVAPTPVTRQSDPPDRAIEPGRAGGVGFQQADDGTLTINGRTVSRGRLFDALMRAAENPRAVNNALEDWTLRILLILVPLLALLGALFIRGRDALIYDHLLLSLQTHAVAFGVLILGLWMVWLVPVAVTGMVFLIGVPIYHARAMRGAFGRSRRRTLLATLLGFAFYWLAAVILLGTAVAQAFSSTL